MEDESGTKVPIPIWACSEKQKTKETANTSRLNFILGGFKENNNGINSPD
jgi:hypothetical protein